jgi:amino acid adenylation domain-containing protein
MTESQVATKPEVPHTAASSTTDLSTVNNDSMNSDSQHGLVPESSLVASPPTWDALIQDSAALEVPTDFLRPKTIDGTTEVVTHTLTSEAAQRLSQLCLQQQVNAEAVLVCVFSALLSRYANESDIVLGLFDNAGVRVTRLANARSTSLRDLLDQNETISSQFQNVAAVDLNTTANGLEPSTNKHPHFQFAARVSTDDSSTDDSSTDDSVETRIDRPVPCDLVLAMAADGAKFAVHYSPSLFRRQRIEQIAQHFANLLDSAITSPTSPVYELEFLTAAELQDFRTWNETACEPIETRTLAEIFSEQVRATPTAVALEFEDRTITFAEVDRLAEELAVRLREIGVGHDVRVAVSMERSCEMIVSLIGILKAGGAYVPIDPAYPADRRDYMIADSNVAAILRLDASTGDVTIDQPGESTNEVTLLSNEPNDPIAYVIYTSGSTGQPKGVVIRNQAICNLLRWEKKQPGFTLGARTLQFNSLSFDYSVEEIFSTLLSGGTLVIVRDEIRRNPMSLLKIVKSANIERLFLPFVALRGLANAACSANDFPTALREVYTAGEQLQIDDVVRRFFMETPNALLENQYGPTEAAVIITAYRLTGNADTWDALPSIGRPIDNTEMFIVDDSNRPCAIGIPGHLLIAGVCLASEYLGKRELTNEKFVELVLNGESKRAYRTGDIARWHHDGTIEFLGRGDSQVKFRGFRIEPGEVGSELSNHPAVEQCMVVIREVEAAGPRLIAFVKWNETHAPTDGDSQRSLQALHEYAKLKLPPQMVPTHFSVIEAFPLTPSGKIDMASLPTPTFDRSILGTAFRRPTTTTQIRMAAIWQRLLGIETLGLDDDFFALGGNSLMAVEMFAMIRNEFDRDLPLGALAAGPTVSQLAEKLDLGSEASDWSILVPIKTRGTKRPLFCVHGGSGNVASFPKLARQLPDDRPFYALQWDGLDGSVGTTRLTDMAKRYIIELRRVQSEGPYLLSGQCVGGLIAQEMTRLLIEQGQQVDLLVMFDSPNVFSSTHVAASKIAYAKSRVKDPKLVANLRRDFGIIRTELQAKRSGNVPAAIREQHAVRVLNTSVLHHEPKVSPTTTLLFSTGLRDASTIGLSGTFTDDALGWSPFASPSFRIYRADGGHNEIMYSARVVSILTDALIECDVH